MLIDAPDTYTAVTAEINKRNIMFRKVTSHVPDVRQRTCKYTGVRIESSNKKTLGLLSYLWKRLCFLCALGK
jgi:hypothetical protein